METNLKQFNENEFNEIVSQLNGFPTENASFLYTIYEYAFNGILELMESQVIPGLVSVDQLELIYYCAGEFLYTIFGKTKDEIAKIANDESYIRSIASVASDKYISLSVFNHVEKKLTNRYLPPVSSLNLYLNFMMNILKATKNNNQTESIISDLLTKSVSISRCIISLLYQGYETEAFSNWRTLHECECTLTLLDKYREPLIKRYFKHMQYGYVFQKADKSDEAGTALFEQMKSEMAEFNLKSKDIKKYIEYGWLYEIPGTKEDPDFKLNFRDGLEKCAGLSNYSKRYELSSEIIHSTPMLIYSNKEYFFFITLLSLYESFFRLEKVFAGLFFEHITKEQKDSYNAFRNVYYAQLVNIHKRESLNFKMLQDKSKR